MLLTTLLACNMGPNLLERQRTALEKATTVHQTESGVWWYEAGAGDTVVLVHGFGDQGGSWLPVVQALQETHRVVVVDLPGHGRSPAPADPPDLQTELAGLEAVLDDATDGPVVLVGNSMGGWLVLQESLDHPERVSQVIPVNAGGLDHPIDRALLIPADGDAMQAKIDTMGVDMQIPGFLRQSLADAQDREFLNALYDGLMSSGFLDDELANSTVQTDLIWGGQDGFFPIDYAQRMDAALPQSSLTVLDGCSHAPQVDCADQFSAAVLTLLSP